MDSNNRQAAVVVSFSSFFKCGFFFENSLEEMAAPKSPIAGANPFPLRHRTAFALSAADPVYIFDLAQVSNLAILNPNRYSTHRFYNIDITWLYLPDTYTHIFALLAS